MKFKEIMNCVNEYLESDVYELLKELNIDITYDNDLAGNKDCRIFSCEDGNCIFIKENLNPLYEQFLILHEIGHYLMHYDISTYFTPVGRIENEANMFACLWLIKNDIDSAQYYDQYLINCGVPINIAIKFQDTLYQFRQSQRYGNVWLRMEC